MRLKLGQNWGKSDSALNAYEEWSKNHCDQMRPNRAVGPQSSKKVLTLAFLINFTLQLLCKDASDHDHFDQHSMHYQTVYCNPIKSLFTFYLI